MPIDYQTGIIADASSDASFVLLTAVPGKEAELRTALANFPKQIQSTQQQFPNSELHAAIGLSIHCWDRVTRAPRPNRLAPFPAFEGADMSVTDEPIDIMLHIRSMRHDATHSLALSLYKSLGDSVTLIHQTNCFKYLDNRDFTGFVDGTENPQGEDKLAVALVGDEDPNYKGGSYLNCMRFVHDLDLWEQQDLKSQEDVYGRTKYANEEYPSNEKSPHAHTKRTSLKDDDGRSIEILRQSMPFGDLQEQGLAFASYSKTPEAFNIMLRSMIVGSQEGHSDHLLKYTHATGGCAFFVPTISFLEQLAND